MSAYQLVLLLITVILIVGLLVLLLPTPLSRSKANAPADRSPETMYRDDDRYWIGGIMYNNPDDPDVFVPKRNVSGRAINVGHPLGKLLMIGMVLLIVALAPTE